jgi:hypothetical protein
MHIHSTQPISSEQAEIFLSTLARRSSEKFVDALRVDPFSDVARGKTFGIVPNDTANDGLGEVVYRAWLEIYVRHLQRMGETRKGDKGPASNGFCEILIEALTNAQLAPLFAKWVEEVVADEAIKGDSNCKKIKDRNLDMSFLIHPTDTTHRESMERFRDKKL